MYSRRVAVAAVLVVLRAIAVTPAGAQTPSVEDKLLMLINGARGRPVVMHAGLREAARAHAEGMAVAGRISHGDAHGRIFDAAPDPPQGHGRPDDGFTGAWCEVAGWEPAGAEQGTAQRFFEDWLQSSEDNACMTNSKMTVAGVGVYQSSGKWWASLDMAEDKTPPKASTASPSSSPGATTSPVIRQSSAPATSRPPSVRDLAESRSTSASSSSSFGLRETLVAVGGFLVVPVIWFARRRRGARG